MLLPTLRKGGYDLSKDQSQIFIDRASFILDKLEQIKAYTYPNYSKGYDFTSQYRLPYAAALAISQKVDAQWRAQYEPAIDDLIIKFTPHPNPDRSWRRIIVGGAKSVDAALKLSGQLYYLWDISVLYGFEVVRAPHPVYGTEW